MSTQPLTDLATPWALVAFVLGAADPARAPLSAPTRDLGDHGSDLYSLEGRQDVIQRPVSHHPGAISLTPDRAAQDDGFHLISAAHQIPCL